MTTVDEANGWYGGTLLGDQDENSEVYRHYAELIQVLYTLSSVHFETSFSFADDTLIIGN